jgi:hypothetical protein
MSSTKMYARSGENGPHIWAFLDIFCSFVTDGATVTITDHQLRKVGEKTCFPSDHMVD